MMVVARAAGAGRGSWSGVDRVHPVDARDAVASVVGGPSARQDQQRPRLSNMQLWSTTASHCVSPPPREIFLVSSRALYAQLASLQTYQLTPPAPSQWHHAPPSPALTPRSSLQPPRTAPRAIHGHDSTLSRIIVVLYMVYSLQAVSNGDTQAPSAASTASRARFPASASRPSLSVHILLLSSSAS
jgi:hypothetical protein